MVVGCLPNPEGYIASAVPCERSAVADSLLKDLRKRKGEKRMWFLAKTLHYPENILEEMDPALLHDTLLREEDKVIQDKINVLDAIDAKLADLPAPHAKRAIFVAEAKRLGIPRFNVKTKRQLRFSIAEKLAIQARVETRALGEEGQRRQGEAGQRAKGEETRQRQREAGQRAKGEGISPGSQRIGGEAKKRRKEPVKTSRRGPGRPPMPRIFPTTGL